MSELSYKRVIIVDDNDVMMVPYVLPATTSRLGIVKPDNTSLCIDDSGALKSNYSYELPVATNTTLGGVKIGTNISINNGTISVPKATPVEFGMVKPDNTTIFIDGNGTISSSGESAAIQLIKQVYPVGAIFIGTTATCPMTLLIPNSVWELVAADRVLQGSSTSHAANTTIPASAPNIKGNSRALRGLSDDSPTGAFYVSTTKDWTGHDGGVTRKEIHFEASRSNTMYSGTTIQPSAYVVNIWKRTA